MAKGICALGEWGDTFPFLLPTASMCKQVTAGLGHLPSWGSGGLCPSQVGCRTPSAHPKCTEL